MCPGQDMRQWRPEDIFNVICPFCGKKNEFFKDDAILFCHTCRGEIKNPKIFKGCAEWCSRSEECTGKK